MAIGREIIWGLPLIFRMRFLKREVSASRAARAMQGLSTISVSVPLLAVHACRR
jgi:hypothetical protein